jgi:glycosyltransferase involved in cell wall biosynthesis
MPDRQGGGAAAVVAAQEKFQAGDEMPLISVVMPTFNRARLLDRALRSVLQQTYRNLEIIVVDDASSDGTAEVVKAIHDPRIRYLRHDSNKGGSAARNTGIRAAHGDYIAFLDDDDQWEPDKTEEQLRVLRHDNYDAVLCTSDEHGERIAAFDGKTTVSLEDLRHGRFTAGGTGVLMAKANVVKETMFDESLPRYQDWDVFIRIGQKYRMGYVNKAFVRYNEGAHQRISNKIVNMRIPELEGELRMVHKHREFFGERAYRWHACRFMLYGIRYRPDRFSHALSVARKYGVGNVLKALFRRLWQRTAHRRDR